MPRQRGPIAIPLPSDDDCLERITSLPAPVAAADESVVPALVTYGLVHQWTSSRAALVEALRRRRTAGLAMLDALEAGRLPGRAELAAWSHGEGGMQLAFPEMVTSTSGDAETVAELTVAVDRHLAGVGALLRHCAEQPDPDVARARVLLRIREAHPGERIIAFCHYTETVQGLRRYLRSTPGVATLTARGGWIASGRISRADIVTQFSPRGQKADGQRVDQIDSPHNDRPVE